ncbi:MAG TPA: hypothetical protein VM554_01375 [Acidisarcina sp.]|nr:hypothetical protein [Acidisarcina sp.]
MTSKPSSEKPTFVEQITTFLDRYMSAARSSRSRKSRRVKIPTHLTI